MTSDGEREVMGLVLTTNAELVSGVLRGAGAPEGPSVMAAVSATRTLDLIVNDILHALVRQARAEGRTWAEIGEVQHVTRQAAFQRFGAAADDPRAQEGVMKPIRGAADKASVILGDWLHERYDAVRRDFDARMLEQCTVEMLQAVRGQTRQTGGEPVEMGAGVDHLHRRRVVDPGLLLAVGHQADPVWIDPRRPAGRSGHVQGPRPDLGHR